MKREELGRFLITQTAVVVEAMQKIDLNAKGILFVIDENEKLAGVVTDGDIQIGRASCRERVWSRV